METVIDNAMMMKKKKKKKTSMGRQRIEMKKIENRAYLQTTFSKRRRGLFNKAAELSLRYGADVAVVVNSPGSKVFTFGSPSPDYVFERFLSSCQKQPPADLNGELKAEKSTIAVNQNSVSDEPFWWEKDVSELSLAQLEMYSAALQELRNNLMAKTNHMAEMERFTTETYGVGSDITGFSGLLSNSH